jgi:hypothetical protein
LVGPIPTEIGSLDLLSFFSIGGNAFTGTIPTELGLNTELSKFLHRGIIECVLRIEHFSNAFFSLLSTVVLALQNNDLRGTIPLELTEFTSMTSLTLNSNSMLSGTIPSEIGQLTALERLFLHFTDFTGTMPQAICDLRQRDLRFLSADCAGENPKVVCPQPSCCNTCF